MTGKYKYEDEWFEEMNVSKKIREFLEENGYKIIKFNENKWQKGHDIEAEKDGNKLIVEVKGYPSKKYVRGKKKGKEKAKGTNPKSQAKHWFGEALLSLLLELKAEPKVKIAIGLPRFKVYEELVEKLEYVRKKLGIEVIFVEENGKVSWYN